MKGYLRFGALAGIGLLLGSIAACGGGSSRSITPPVGGPVVAAFGPSGTAAAANRVRLNGSASGDTVTVDVRIGGATTSQDLFGFAFDLRGSNPGLLTLLSSTAGDALQPGSSGLTVQVAPVSGGWTVGVSKLGAEPGNGIAAGESSVIRLIFRLNATGSSTLFLDGTGTSSPAALDSNTQPIPSVAFDASSVNLSGS